MKEATITGLDSGCVSFGVGEVCKQNKELLYKTRIFWDIVFVGILMANFSYAIYWIAGISKTILDREGTCFPKHKGTFPLHQLCCLIASCLAFLHV